MTPEIHKNPLFDEVNDGETVSICLSINFYSPVSSSTHIRTIYYHTTNSDSYQNSILEVSTIDSHHIASKEVAK